MSDELNRLKERLEKDPDSLLFAQYADLLRKEGLLEEAIEIAERGIEKHPEYATGFLVLGRCFKEKKGIEQAIKHLDTASKLDRQSILALKELSELYMEQNDNISAKRVLNRLLELDPLDREAKRMLREIEEKESKEVGGLDEEGLSSYFKREEFPSLEEEPEAEEEELVVEEEKLEGEPKSSFEEIDIEGLKGEELKEEEPELSEVPDEEEKVTEEVSEEEIESIFSLDEGIGGEETVEFEEIQKPEEEAVEEILEEEEVEEEVSTAYEAEEVKEEFGFEEFFGKEEEEIKSEEKPPEATVIEEEKVEEVAHKEEMEFTEVFGDESIDEEIEEFEEIREEKEEVEKLEEIEEAVIPIEEEKEEVKVEVAREREVSEERRLTPELAELYQKRGFVDKALEIYEGLYEKNKDEEIKKKIDELKSEAKKKDLSESGKKEGDEGIFSKLDKKAPIETEGFKKGEIQDKSKEVEGEDDDSFHDWIDGLSGK